MKNYFQASLDVEGRPCLIVGGGHEAEEKTGRLLDAAAQVTVVSPEATPGLEAWAAEGVITLHRRTFQPGDLDGVWLAVNTVKSDPALSRQIFELCEAQRILISAYDQPETSNFVMVALVRCGRLRTAFATGGVSPALASRLRAEFEHLFDATFAEFTEYLAEMRLRLEAAMPKGPARSEALRQLVRGLRVRGAVEYPPDYHAWRAARQATPPQSSPQQSSPQQSLSQRPGSGQAAPVGR
ncbi:MAG: precorrin-2 dehydrogenase/sirohydrochlorin ferrochelatase family protein [Chloroflexota bacterium]